MIALVHRVAADNAPAGVWWLPKHQSVPQSKYLDNTRYPAGARAVLGDDWNGQPFTLAQWQAQVERLTESSTPFAVWTSEDTKDPQALLFPPT